MNNKKKEILKLHKALGVSEESLAREKVFNSFIGFDSELYVDPRLLQIITLSEFNNCYQNFREHFRKVIKILKFSQKPNDLFFKKAVKNLIFREPKFLTLGYSNEGNSGRGIGPKLANNIAITAQEIIQKGIDDPEIFEIMGFFEDGIGADRISDMTSRLILQNLAHFSENIASKLNLETRRTNISSGYYLLPINKFSGSPVILLPQDILNDLPVANDRSDIDDVVSHNSELRNQINSMIGEDWKKASSNLTKKEIKALFLDNIDALRELIDLYRKSKAEPYDFDKDPLALFKWLEVAKEYTESFPLNIDPIEEVTPRKVLDIILVICSHFKKLVEDNGLCIFFWREDKETPIHEKYAQRLFFAVAKSYCEANNLDLSPESDSGQGPIDFKFSNGDKAKVNVEIKYTKNKIKHAYEIQLPTYNKAEGIDYSVLLIIKNCDQEAALKKLIDQKNNDKREGKETPEIIVVDGRIKPSASTSKEL